MEAKSYFSHGKLLITSEYFVLDGAQALALPTRPGQDLKATAFDDQAALIYWKTFRQERLWLELVFNYRTEKILETNNSVAAEFIIKLFRILKEMESARFLENRSYKLHSNIEFPEDYGLGSSSTLINNLSNWAQVDAFTLNDRALGGSGYDIAVARASSPILYTKTSCVRNVEKVVFQPTFKDDLIFIHLNKKQNTREGISDYRQKPKSPELVQKFTDLTNAIIHAEDLEKFSVLITNHERLIADFFGIRPVKEKYFSDAPTFVKSLGAWGGDFVMSSVFDQYENYFKSKGFPTILTYRKLIA